MKYAAPLLLLAAAATNAFTTPSVSSFGVKPVTTLEMSATEVAAFQQGPRIVRDELPIVFVYDHCPFCVRVRLALGIKNVKHLVQFLANDDIPTPTKLLGKKIAPIFVSTF